MYQGSVRCLILRALHILDLLPGSMRASREMRAAWLFDYHDVQRNGLSMRKTMTLDFEGKVFMMAV